LRSGFLSNLKYLNVEEEKEMKRIIVFLIFYVQITFATVDTRLVFVSNTNDFPSPGLSTLVLDVEALSNAGDVLINLYQNAIQLDANFRAQNPTVVFTNQLFPSAAYNTTQDYRSTDGRIRFVYTYNAGTKSTVLGTYTRVVTISIQYTTVANSGSISWFTGLPNYTVADGNNVTITGTRLTIPSELNSIPLPVELSSFTSKLINDKVQLNWQTKTEVSNYGFNVERSVKDGEWSTIGFVEGYGNSNSTKFYSFSDKDLFAGGSEFRYRLKQIDTDGKFEYSDVVAVTVIPAQFELAQNYPNPFNPSTTIRFSLPQSAQIKLNVYNLLGQQIATIAEGLFEQGFHKVEFNASDLPSGAYIYRIESSEFVQVKKMVLIK
jgi:hypothetical protein